MTAPLFEIQLQKQANVGFAKGLLSRKIMHSKKPSFLQLLLCYEAMLQNTRVSCVPFSLMFIDENTLRHFHCFYFLRFYCTVVVNFKAAFKIQFKTKQNKKLQRIFNLG